MLSPMLVLMLSPAVLSALVLAAHFLRRGQLAPCALCLAAAALPALRRRWVPGALQAFLTLGTLLWMATLRAMVDERIDNHEPWHRLVYILGGTACVSALGVLLVSTRRVREHYAGAAPGESGARAAGPDTA